MPRDYAKKSPPRKKKSPTPGWVWLLSGLLLGLFVAFLTYLASTPTGGRMAQGQDRPEGRAAGDRPARQAKAPAAPEPEQGAPEERYDFYKILPEMEIAVPEASSGGGRDGGPAPTKKISEPGRYILQVGSFKRARDADRRKAELALLGLVATIQKVTVDGTQTWHRVQVGPIQDLDRVQAVRDLLGENGFQYLVLKQKG